MMYDSLPFHAQAVLAQGSQVQQQAAAPGAGQVGVTLIVVLVCVGIWYVVKHKGGKVLHISMGFVAGALLAGSVFGGIAIQSAGALGTGLATMLTTIAPVNTGTGR